MAVKTEFNQEDFENILSNYSLGEFISFIPFETGADQTNILVITTKGKFVLRYYEKRSVEYVLFEIDLLHYLTTHSYPTASPIKNKKSEHYGIYKDKPYALFEFMEGEHKSDEENCLLVTEKIAQLHEITLNYTPVNADSRASYSQEYCLQFAIKGAEDMENKTEAQNRLEWVKTQLNTINIPNILPKGICHGDVNPTNFLYKNGQISAVLDFDQSSYTWLLHDIAQLIYWWAWPNNGELDLEKIKEIIKKYELVRKLTEEEKSSLYDVLKLVNLIGIAWDMGSDDFESNRKRVEYLNILGKEQFIAFLLN